MCLVTVATSSCRLHFLLLSLTFGVPAAVAGVWYSSHLLYNHYTANNDADKRATGGHNDFFYFLCTVSITLCIHDARMARQSFVQYLLQAIIFLLSASAYCVQSQVAKCGFATVNISNVIYSMAQKYNP